MIKQMKQFLIFGALFALGTVLFAQTEADFEVALTEDGNGAVIKKYTGKVTNTIRIPATIEGLPVREIGERAFFGAGVSNSMGMLKTDVPFAVVLPQGLIKIGDEAFADSALTGVVIPDSVTEIGEMAFANYEIYTWAGSFKPPNPLLTSVTLPKGLTKAGKSVFSGNSALKTVVIPEGCSVLGEYMFERCTALTAITIPKSITSIPSNAFANCTGLKTLVIPEGLTEIGGGSSGTGAFGWCAALTSVTLPSTITVIGPTAFRGCSALTTVTIPDSVETIDGGNDVSGERTLLEWAFSDCGKLSLAVQARLKKITVVSYQKEREKLEQAQKQREQEERRAQEKREQEEREAQVQAERTAQAKREQEEREAQRQRAEEERTAQAKREQEEREAERAAQAKRDEERRVQQAKQAEATKTVLEFGRKFGALAGAVSGAGSRINNKQFAEFMDVYEKYIASGLSDLDTSNWDYSARQNFELYIRDTEGNIRRCMNGMNNRQKKQFDTKFR
jgi:flagellar biosynthesis GTPase FlhF